MSSVLSVLVSLRPSVSPELASAPGSGELHEPAAGNALLAQALACGARISREGRARLAVDERCSLLRAALRPPAQRAPEPGGGGGVLQRPACDSGRDVASIAAISARVSMRPTNFLQRRRPPGIRRSPPTYRDRFAPLGPFVSDGSRVQRPYRPRRRTRLTPDRARSVHRTPPSDSDDTSHPPFPRPL